MKMPGMSRSRRRYSSDQAPPLISAVIEMETNQVTGSAQLRRAIQLQPDLDERDNDGFTALMYAVRLNLPNAISDLVKLGATVDLKDEDGNTPFFYACIFKNWSVVETLLKVGADPEIHNQNGLTALLTAIEAQDEGLVDGLLKLGVSPNRCSAKGTPGLVLALSHKHLRYNKTILSYLLNAGADVNMADGEGVTPLMQACHAKRRYTEVVQLLIEWKAKLDLRDSQGRTALHYCLQDSFYNPHCQRLLLKAGASCNAADDIGNTPLSLLARGYKSSMSESKYDSVVLRSLRKLISQGADPNLVTAVASPVCLMRAVLGWNCSYEAVRTLLAAGAEPISCQDFLPLADKDFNTPSSSRPSALITAIDNGKLDTARLLVDGLFYTHEDVVRFSTNSALNTTAVSRNSSATSTLSPASRRPQLASASNLNTFTTETNRTETAVAARNSTGSTHSLITPSSTSAASTSNRNIRSAALHSISPLMMPSSATLTRVSSMPSMFTASVSRGPPANSSNNYRSTSGSIPGTTVLSYTNRTVLSHATRSEQNEPATASVNQNRIAQHRTQLNTTSSTSQNTLPFLQASDIQEIASSISHDTPSLQQLSRRVIHRAMTCRRERARQVKDLPIWPKLQRYILFHGSEYLPGH